MYEPSAEMVAFRIKVGKIRTFDSCFNHFFLFFNIIEKW